MPADANSRWRHNAEVTSPSRRPPSTVAVVVASLFEIIPAFLIRSNVPTIASVGPYTPLELAGRDLYIAEEMFVCGTAAEVSAVNSVDDRLLPCPGPMTRAVAEVFSRAVRGQEDKYKDWCEHVG